MERTTPRPRPSARKHVAILFVLVPALLAATPSQGTQARRWTVADSVRVDRVLYSAQPSTGIGGERFIQSPDGRFVAYVVETAEPSGAIRNVLRVHRTDEVRRFAAGAAPPRDLADLNVDMQDWRPSISQLSWSRTGALFLLRRDGGRNALFEWTETAGARPLGSDAFDIDSYTEVDDRTVALTVARGVERITAPTAVTGRSMLMLQQQLFGVPSSARGGPSYLSMELWLLDRSTGEVRRVDARIQDQPGVYASPDGRYLAFVEAMVVQRDGACWARMWRDPGSTQLAGQLAILDRATGEIARPFAAPLADGTVLNPVDQFVAWSRDGAHLAVAATFTEADRCGGARQDSQLGVYALRIRDGHRQKLLGLDVTDLGFMPSTVARLEARDEHDFAVGIRPVPTMYYQTAGMRPEGVVTADLVFTPDARGAFRQHREDGRQAGGSSTGGMLDVCEGLNEPPTICVRNGSATRTLFDLSARIRDVALDPMTIVHWVDSQGVRWSGYLQRPGSDGPAPLIVQTHGDMLGADGRSFLTSGPATSVYPGRAAVAKGYAVLTVVEPQLPGGPRDEPRRMLDGYRAAVAMLAGEGIADRSRVGIVGFSRTSYYTKFILTQAPELFQAAVVADGLDYSYWGYAYLQDWGGDIVGRHARSLYGGNPPDRGTTWATEAPDLLAASIHVPTRIEGYGPMSITGEWGFYAAMRAGGQPVDIIYYPSDVHHLRQPADRIASQTGTLDWFDFWLRGIEHRDPPDPDQYERWRAMRAQSAQRNPASARTRGPGD